MSTCKNKGCPGHARRGQLDKANKPVHGACGTACQDMPCVPRKVCNHPSAKVRDETEPLRRKVAELEGRLALQQLRSRPRMAPSAGMCYTVALLTFTGIGALLGFLINLG